MKAIFSLIPLIFWGSSDQGIAWKTSIEAGLREAKIRNVPVLVLLTKDGESASDDTWKIYGTKKVLEFADRTVFVAGHWGSKHKTVKKKVEGRSVQICTLYGGSCKSHEKSWEEIRDKFIKQEFYFPVQIFLFPNGEESYRFQKFQSAKLILEELTRLVEKTGKGVSSKEYAKIRAEIFKARDESREGKYDAGRRRLKKLMRKKYPQSMLDHIKKQLENL